MIDSKKYIKNPPSVKRKGILIITPTYYPDVGGVETHLTDLVSELSKKSELKIFVATYKPIATSGVKSYIKKEVFGNVVIYRYWWFGWNLFHFFEKYPLLQFLYLCPYLCFRSIILMVFNKKEIGIIHGQGLTGAFVGMVLKKIFKKKLIVSTHAIYEIDKTSQIAKCIKYILNQADKILCLSDASYDELISFGLKKSKLGFYKYWINLNNFRPLNKIKIRKELGIENRLTVLFVGRLMEIKGVKILCEVVRKIPEINFIFIGHGPLEGYLNNMDKNYKNILFLGKIHNKELYKYYNCADVFCLPSQYEEGFGRVIMEAISCGIPVVASNMGGIPEAVNESVAVLVEPTVENLEEAIEDLYNDGRKLERLRSNCKKYAEENFSGKNIELITKYY